MKKLSLVVTLVLFAIGAALAQKTISGKITDAKGEPLVGASLLVNGTSVGTVADVDGNYTLTVPPGSKEVTVSYTGFATQKITIGDLTELMITLEESDAQLTEVVVTGLGIRKEKKALGYGVSTITTEALTNRPETDVARLLRGKATGVDITQTSGLAGSGTNVIIRGYKSISGNNQPLFVIDGIPFNTDTNADRGFGSGGATASSRFLDLDPNNIAEISILKGLSATVLYGEAGRNGVILVTTRNGRAGQDIDKGMEVSVTQSVFQSEISNLPDYQDTYGNGFGGDFGWFFSNWGAPFAARGTNGVAADGTVEHPYDQAQYNDDVPEYKGVRYPYQPYKSVENFFKKGLSSNTSIAISNNLGNGSSFNASYSYLTDNGFTPDLDAQRGSGSSNYYNKHNFGLGGKTVLGNGLKVSATFNYVDSDRRTPITSQAFGGDSEGQGGLFGALLFTPRSIDLMNLPYQSPLDGSNIYYRRGSAIQNPRWTLNNAADLEKIRRFFSTVELGYQLAPWLNAQYRLGIDQYAQQSIREINRGGSSAPDGFLQTSNRLNRITDQVFNLLYNKNIGTVWSLDGVLGVNLRREVKQLQGTVSSNQFVYGLFTHDNFINTTGYTGTSEENTIGAYATATLGFRNFLYLNLQGRNDWTSTLEKANRSFFYPSASVAFIPTEAFASLADSKVLNYLKLRVGYGTSAGYPDPYQTRSVLGTATNQFVTAGGKILNINTVSDRLGNPNLKPEVHREVEAGIEAKLFKNIIGIDLSLYDKTSSDLIVDLDLDPATGYTNTTVNAAEINNRGVEFGLNITPFSGKFTWDINLNYTKNISEVKKIADGVNQVLIDGFSTLGNFARVGEPYGVMLGTPFVRNENGDLLTNAVGGYIIGSEIAVIGDPNPNFTANWNNNFSWNGFSFGFQWQYIDGGSIYSSTVQSLLARGNTKDTEFDRYLPVILPGVKESDGKKNDIQVYAGDEFFTAYFGADEGGVFDGTVIRLRQVSLAYVLPQKLVKKTPFGRLGLTISGENMWYNAPNFPEYINFDPEVLSLGVGNGRGFDLRSAPTAKKYGITLNATF